MKAIALVMLSTLSAIASEQPGAHITPERAQRIENTIKFQHAILPISGVTAPITEPPYQGSTVEPTTATKSVAKEKAHGTKR